MALLKGLRKSTRSLPMSFSDALNEAKAENVREGTHPTHTRRRWHPGQENGGGKGRTAYVRVIQPWGSQRWWRVRVLLICSMLSVRSETCGDGCSGYDGVDHDTLRFGFPGPPSRPSMCNGSRNIVISALGVEKKNQGKTVISRYHEISIGWEAESPCETRTPRILRGARLAQSSN